MSTAGAFLISPAVPIDRRLWTLAHELAHGHFLATGIPSDVEGLCDLFATMYELTMRDL
jgi:Zn-dependent peptidase ImmA (M78 family)